MKKSSFYIYGAGIVAASLYTAIKSLHNLTPAAFVVSNREGNPSWIDNIPVMEVSEGDVIDSLSKYLIATPQSHHKVIADSLCKLGIAREQLIFADNHFENNLMERYYAGLPDFTTVKELLTDRKTSKIAEYFSLKDIIVFQAKSHVDKPLTNQLALPAYIQPIQVGTDLTEKVIADIQDNIGENISGKNRNYCELTAAYCLWKNSRAPYKGLCHYRRIFDMSEEQLVFLLSGNEKVDVILPYPSVHYPDISDQHTRYVSEEDWNAMLLALKEVAPDYYEAYTTAISGERYFYNFNMLIARRAVFDDYCQFLFSVLERTEELTSPKGWERADRFAGYLGENLTTLYFRKNRDKLKIVHAGKIWIT